MNSNAKNIKVQSIVVTLFEKHYHYGVASLVNSLCNVGFEGLIYIGYRGELPFWTNQLEKASENDFHVNQKVTISFELLKTEMHFGYYKPHFMKDTLSSFPDAQNIYYFDPDIVINASWCFFSSWVENGITLCLDNSFPFVQQNHPWRHEWKKLIGSELTNNIDYYVNSGFIGLKREDSIILDRWIELTEKYRENGGSINMFKKNGHRAIKSDQDLLNAVITVSPDLNFSVIGSEGMGFTQPAYLMSHAVNDIKPWKNNFLLSAIDGRPPCRADKEFWLNSTGIINTFSPFTIIIKRFIMLLATFIGRFYRRQ